MTTEHQPRDEAFVPDWPKDPKDPGHRELDPQQYEAACGVHRFFLAMARRPFEESTDTELYSFLPRLDARRSNHAVLIDGPRGSGKTGVMLRLIEDWASVLRGKEPSNLPVDILLKDVEVVPVGLLDLEAVPKAANLATRIAGIFERVVSAIEHRGNKRGLSTSPAWAHLDADELKSRGAWQQFVKAAAVEWDQSLERRRANIDPEAYAVEVEQAERQGLNAGACFRAFVDALVKDWQQWPPRRGALPFFVVPIDDADLNPGRVVELFELMRRLWHPRVGFLLTGDSSLFQSTLAPHFVFQIARKLTRPTLNTSETADKLARDLFQKAIPLAQRLKLQPLPGNKRLDALLSSLGSKLDANREWVRYLRADAHSALALPSRWRQLNDLCKLIETGRFGQPVRAELVAMELWRHALNEAPTLNDALTKFRISTYLDDDMSKLGIEQLETLRMAPFPTDKHTENGNIVRIRVQREFRFDSKLDGGGADWGHGFHQRWLSDSTVAAWLFLNNVAEQCPRPDTSNLALVETTFSATSIIISIKQQRPSGSGPAVPRRPPAPPPIIAPQPAHPQQLELGFRWRIPEWDRPYDVQRLLDTWNAITLRHKGDIDQLARAFISATFDISGHKTSPSKLAQQVTEQAKEDTPLGRWSLHTAGLLAAPEYGLTVAGANRWLNELKACADKIDGWTWLRSRLRHNRQTAIEKAITAAQAPSRGSSPRLSSKHVCEQINKSALDYNWRSLIEEAPS